MSSGKPGSWSAATAGVVGCLTSVAVLAISIQQGEEEIAGVLWGSAFLLAVAAVSISSALPNRWSTSNPVDTSGLSCRRLPCSRHIGPAVDWVGAALCRTPLCLRLDQACCRLQSGPLRSAATFRHRIDRSRWVLRWWKCLDVLMFQAARPLGKMTEYLQDVSHSSPHGRYAFTTGGPSTPSARTTTTAPAGTGNGG